jgi:hypothetical protein
MKFCVLLLSLFVLPIISSCEGFLGEYTMKYTVTGTASTVNITISGKNESTEQFSNVLLPWEYSFTGYDGDFVYVSAQNNGSTGTVTVKIFRSGNEMKTATSSGAYVIATASGSI